jgi:hypothetical protein
VTWEFTNNLNWDLVLRNTYNAQPITVDGSQFSPIPAITVLVDSKVLLIGARNDLAKPNWYFAGSVSARLLFSPSSTSEFLSIVESSRRGLGLNRLNLLRFNDYDTSNYLLEINLARWHKRMFLEIWKYSGAMGDLESDLSRIESKIDNFTT